MRPIGQGLVRLTTRGWTGEGNDEEEDIGSTEKGGCEQGEELLARPVRVGTERQPDDAEGDDGVDDGEGIRDLEKVVVSIEGMNRRAVSTYDIDDEVVGISGGKGEDDDEADDPVQSQARQRSVEGSVGAPELAKGEDTLTTEFLVNTSL